MSEQKTGWMGTANSLSLELAHHEGYRLHTETTMRRNLYEKIGELWVGDCLLYTSDAADERSSVDLGGRRIIKKKKRYDRVVTRSRTEIKSTISYTEVHDSSNQDTQGQYT